MGAINFSGSVGVPGGANGQYILGTYDIVMGNANHLMPPVEFSNKFLKVTSSTALTQVWTLYGPNNQGQEFVIQNDTTGGFAIQIAASSSISTITPTGTGITVPNGQTVSVLFDGTNYITVNVGSATVGGDLSGTTTSATVVSAENGSILFQPSVLEFANTVSTPVITQQSATSGNGQVLTIGAQNATASATVGGSLVLESGTGTTSPGNLTLSTGTTPRVVVNGANGVVAVPAFTTGVVHSDGSGNLSSSAIFNSDVANTAAIAVTKLASGASAQVLLNNSTPAPTWTSITGDVLLNNQGATTVQALQGNPVLSQTLGSSQDGYVLAWKYAATAWEATPITSGSTTLGGDVTGLSTSNTVGKIQNYAVASTNPSTQVSGQYHPAFIWNPTLSRYDVRVLTQDDIAPGFSISSFGTSQTVEVGYPFSGSNYLILTASYNAVPATAQITNTDGLTSPITLSSPFTTTGTAYQTTTFNGGNASHTTTFTLTATATTGVQKTAGVTLTWEPRMFAGTGAPNAAATATASGNNAVLSTGDILYSSTYGPTLAPGSSAIGSTFTVSGVGNKIYLLLPGGPYSSFYDTNAGAAFAMKTTPTGPISFFNQNGATVTMYLYESLNTLTTTPPQQPFAIKVLA